MSYCYDIDGSTSRIFAGYDTYREESVNPNIAQPNDHNAQLEVWLNHADMVLSHESLFLAPSPLSLLNLPHSRETLFFCLLNPSQQRWNSYPSPH